MAVLLETSAGELVIDLFTDECPIAAKNFLKLCKLKYYHGCLFYNVQPNFICQTGDPTGTGQGGMSIYGLTRGPHSNYFPDEIVKTRRMDKVGLVCMAHEKENANASQFFITLRGDDLEDLEGRYTILGEVAEGLEVLEKINNLYCDGEGRPYQDLRIKHTHIIEDEYDDPVDFPVPPDSPTYSIHPKEIVKRRIPFEQSLEEDFEGRTEEEIEESIRRKEAQSRAIVLEMTGDIPDAEVKPPTEVLFVCKLNAVTTDADLELIFSQFGTIKQCEIIRDFKTGDSLNYAFIEFEVDDACIKAYEKMNNVLIDDRRIKVDFSQSVSKLWNKYLQQPRGTGKRVMGSDGTVGAKDVGKYGDSSRAAGHAQSTRGVPDSSRGQGYGSAGVTGRDSERRDARGGSGGYPYDALPPKRPVDRTEEKRGRDDSRHRDDKHHSSDRGGDGRRRDGDGYGRRDGARERSHRSRDNGNDRDGNQNRKDSAREKERGFPHGSSSSEQYGDRDSRRGDRSRSRDRGRRDR